MVALLPVILCLVAVQDHGVKASPFDGLRWNDGAPEVQVGDEWYRPVAIDGVAVPEILDFCERRWRGQREKRFREDLVEAMRIMGWRGDLDVDLDLVRVADGAPVRLEGVRMTAAKRQSLWKAARGTRPAVRAPPPPPVVVAREEALRDVDAFARGLGERFAYLERREIDLDGELDRVRARLGEEVDTRDLAAALHEVLMLYGDGHARVGAPGGARRDGDFLPFLLARSSAGVVAVRPDRTGLVDAARPLVVALDGQPLETWLEAVRPRVPAGSPQLVLHRSLRELRAIDAARRALGRPAGGPVRVAFAGGDGRRPAERELALVEEKPLHGDWPRTENLELPGRIGYLRIARMDGAVDALRRWMEEFRRTRALVVDVRGNGGGSREILRVLAGYLIRPDDPAVVASVAAYRLAEDFPEDHLEARFMYRASWEGWSARQRAAIEALDFTPEWEPPAGDFSDWHYLVLDRTGQPDEFHYDRPVVVLSDAGCFSATDVFLGALSLFPNVTLVGQPSSGGSARVQAFRLPASGIEVRCASMASFRPDGRLYDGRGVEVDVEVLPAPGDHAHGGGDAQLEAALELLGRR